MSEDLLVVYMYAFVIGAMAPRGWRGLAVAIAIVLGVRFAAKALMGFFA